MCHAETIQMACSTVQIALELCRCARRLRACRRCRTGQSRVDLGWTTCVSFSGHSEPCSLNPFQVPGLIVVELLSADATKAPEGVRDPKYERIVAAFNARPEAHLLRWPPGLSPAAGVNSRCKPRVYFTRQQRSSNKSYFGGLCRIRSPANPLLPCASVVSLVASVGCMSASTRAPCIVCTYARPTCTWVGSLKGACVLIRNVCQTCRGAAAAAAPRPARLDG
jgi:hypothetical protein